MINSFKYVMLLIVATIANSYAQVNFSAGYFIDNENVKTTCLIKNLDWQNNPVGFEYKLNENATVMTRDINNTKEFEISGITKYKRFKVNIDKTAIDYSRLSTSSAPEFVEETLFLKYVVEGDVSLLVYSENSSMPCYFVAHHGDNVEQLFFKKYLIDANTVARNNYYRIQLASLLKGDLVTSADIQKVDYNGKDLSKLFFKFNNQSSFAKYTKNVKRDVFNIYAKIGLVQSKFGLGNSELNSTSHFDPEMSLRYGVEFEYVLPVNNNKWSVYIEPTYNAFKTSQDFNYVNTPTIVRSTRVTLDYKSFQIPLGFRYYMFLNQKSKLFLNIAMAYDINNGSTLTSKDENYPIDLDVESTIFFSGGFGYNYNNIFSIEAKYDRRNVTNYVSWNTYMNNLSIILAYNIFRKTKK